jgi:hypothetical protein
MDLIVKTKKCSNCQERKDINEFWWIIKNAKRDSWCKECQCRRKRIRNRQRRLIDPVFREREQEANRRCYTIEKARVRTRKWREDNWEKSYVHYLVQQAIKHGKLIKKPCEVCGNVKSEAHHPNYCKSYVVVWLCRRHHAMLNRKES